MFHRFTTWWRALSVVLLSLATVTWPTAAHAGTTVSFNLAHQSSVAQLSAKGSARFGVTLDVGKRPGAAVVQISLYPRIIERSQLTAIYDGAGVTGASLATTGNFTLKCVTHGTAEFTVNVFTTKARRESTPCLSQPARLHLVCASGQCDGVYPLSYSVTKVGITTTEWSLLTIEATSPVRPLQLDVIEALDPSSLRASAASQGVLNAIAHLSSFPLTLTADYRTLAAVEQLDTPSGVAWRDALNKALASPLHRAAAAPPSNIDFAGLVRHGFPSQVSQQISLCTQLLQKVTGHYADGAVVLTGSPTVRDIRALTTAHVSEIVLPDTSLNPSPTSTLTWGAPFKIAGTPSITALATDTPLQQLAMNTSIGPGRRAVLTLGTLAFLHFEAPNAPATRTVVMEVPVAKTSSAYLDALADGLSHDPFAVASNLSPSFDSSLIATNGAPATRVSAASATWNWSSRNINTLTTLINQVNSFGQAVKTAPVIDSLDVEVASAQITGDTTQRQNLLNDASTALFAQLSNFSIDESPITLTGPGTALPITVLSHAKYPVTAVVHLITDRLSFPKGSNVTVTLNSVTTSIRVPTSNHLGSDLTLQVVVTSPNGQLVLARSAIQVRIAGNSLVGYLLTLASLLVLAYWWIRTYRRKTKGHHAR
ncbi:MAG: hypothetical protein HIU84_00230 [Acidobacteria bacterium]|nr:hypothetical protein [Acidobacteriota bacterium]